jgi:hypothetical protein
MLLAALQIECVVDPAKRRQLRPRSHAMKPGAKEMRYAAIRQMPGLGSTLWAQATSCWSLPSLLLGMRVAMPVAKQVHQRAGEKQQIRSRGEGVSGMRPQQIGANSCDQDCRCQSNLGAEEAVERIHGQSEQIAAFGYHRSKQRVRGRSTCVQRGVVQIRSASSPTCGARRTRRIRACLIRCVDGLLRQRLNAQRAV